MLFFIVVVIVYVQYLVRCFGLEYLLVRTVFAVEVAGDIGMVRDLVAFPALNLLSADTISVTVGSVGSNDVVILIDDHEAVIGCVYDTLKVDGDTVGVGHDASCHCHYDM
jgi:hypothetical protein